MDDLEVGRLTIPGNELEETYSTAGGPGGQHANRSETAVRLRFSISDSSLPEVDKRRLTEKLGESVEVTSSESRSQFRNRAIARRRLRERLEEALAEAAPRKPTRPTRASKKRRVADKRARGEVKKMRRAPRADD